MNALGELAADWPQLNRLLDEVLALPPPERQGWLLALPAEHQGLKETLARLLDVRVGIETGDFLSTLPKLDHVPAPRPETPDAGAPRPGDAVGPWRLIRELGEGGMGSVWLAERADGSLKRQVALKLPRLTWARGLAERMARERDILATLEHPHIARLYDAGVDSGGRPWLALEYVQGQPIDVHARDRALALRQRLGLLLQVCEAVAYAHSRLVIHRDLKPGNILVTDDGQVRLLDFGIAKLMRGAEAGASALTAMSGRALTLDYASPEQVRGQALSTASDVFSLGVVAYELLAGARPYRLRRGSAAELEEAIEHADVPAPSMTATNPTDRKGLRGDLDAILLQALRKDPAARYGSVEALAADLSRHLEGLPVSARPDGWGYRMGKLLKRRRLEAGIVAGVGAAALGGLQAQAAVALAVGAGSGFALWQRRQAIAQRDAAEVERRRAEAAAAAARESEREASHQARRAEEVKSFALSLFELADSSLGGAGIGTTAVELLGQARRRIDDELTAQPQVAFELKVALASSLASLGDRPGARQMLADLLDTPQAAAGPLAMVDRVRVQARLRYGDVLCDLGDGDAAMRQLRLAEADAAQGGWPELQAEAVRNQANVLGRLGDYSACSARAQVAVGLAQTPGVDAIIQLRCWSTLADALFAERRPGVVEAAGKAVALGDAAFGARAAEPVLHARQMYANGLLLDGRPREAVTQLRAVHAAREAMLGPMHLGLGTSLNSLVGACMAEGDPAGALQASLRMREVFRVGEPDNVFAQAVAEFRHGTALEAGRAWSAAAASYREALALAARSERSRHGYTVAWRGGLAQALARAGAPASGLAELPSIDAHPFVDELDAAIRQRHMAVVFSLAGLHAQALALAAASHAAGEAITSPLTRVLSHVQHGFVRWQAGHATDAVALLLPAEREIAARVRPESPDLAECRLVLGAALLDEGRVEASMPLLEQARDAYVQLALPAPEQGRAAALLALALRAAGHHAHAAALASGVAEVLADSHRADDQRMLQSLACA